MIVAGDALLVIDALHGLQNVAPVGPVPIAPEAPDQDQVLPRLAAWARDFAAGQAAATLKAVRADWGQYIAWCDGSGHPPLPASADQLHAFLANGVVRGRKRSTLKRYVYTVGLIHEAAGLVNPATTPVWPSKWKAIGKALGERTKPGPVPGTEEADNGNERDQAGALTTSDRDAILATLGDSPFDQRDAALLSLAADTLLREAELVAVRLEHFRYDSGTDGWALWVPTSKTNRTGEKLDYRYVDAATMERIRTWQRVAGIERGLLFRPIGSRARGYSSARGGSSKARTTDSEVAMPLMLPEAALRPREVARIFRQRARAAGLMHAESISGHSARIGMANDLINAGFTTAQIQDAGGWRSAEMVYLYTARSRAGSNAVAELRRQQSKKSGNPE